MTDHGGAASPRTEAGKRLLVALGAVESTVVPSSAVPFILAIEAEAAQEAPAPEGLRAFAEDAIEWADRAEETNEQDAQQGLPTRRYDFVGIAEAARRALATPPAPEGLRAALLAAIGTTDADDGLAHFHEADGKPGVFVDRQQVLDAIDRVLG